MKYLQYIGLIGVVGLLGLFSTTFLGARTAVLEIPNPITSNVSSTTGVFTNATTTSRLYSGGTIQAASTITGSSFLTAAAQYLSTSVLVDLIRASSASPLDLRGNATNASSSYGLRIGATTALTTAGAKIVGFFSNGTYTLEQAYIDYEGTFSNNGGRIVGVTTINTPTSTLATRDYILHNTYSATGISTTTIPTAQMVSGREFCVKDAGNNATTNNIVLETQGAELIEFNDTLTINSSGVGLCVYSNGVGWFVENRN